MLSCLLCMKYLSSINTLSTKTLLRFFETTGMRNLVLLLSHFIKLIWTIWLTFYMHFAALAVLQNALFCNIKEPLLYDFIDKRLWIWWWEVAELRRNPILNEFDEFWNSPMIQNLRCKFKELCCICLNNTPWSVKDS